ncbi:hypothetical protein V5O48_010975 [Marasmius crinis-equi]|uniref:Hydrophobin n=1 Tax=Marasmius crinis-equi TaxID=585013 RepID=A0ABR3F7C0_9AGAR
MFSRIHVFFFALSSTMLVVAMPAGNAATRATGGVQCCDTFTTASDPAAAAVLASMGITVQDPDTAVGLTCSPITVIGGRNGPCSASTLCCEDNSDGGLISIGCVPVSD